MPVPGHVGLGGVDAAGVVGHLAEVPALAVDVDLPAVDAVPLQGQRVERGAQLHHVPLHVVAHQVEAEAVHLVVAAPR